MFKRAICAVISCTLLLTGCSKSVTVLNSHVVNENNRIIYEIHGIKVKQDEQNGKVYWELGGRIYEYEAAENSGNKDIQDSIEKKVLESTSECLVHMLIYVCLYYVLVFLDV